VGRALILGILAAGGLAAQNGRWLEGRSANFVIVSNGAERQARQVAGRLERIRGLVAENLPLRTEPGKPLLVLAARDESTLKDLLPGAWDLPGRPQAAGFYLSVAEKNFIAVRLDVPGGGALGTVYHEYVHMLVQLNLPSLPLWLNEGLAEVVGQSSGPPPARWLPLAELFAVDKSSPHYNEHSRASVFYAQSRALTHMLLFAGPQPDAGLLTLITLLRDGVPAKEATRQAFPDLPALERRLEIYGQKRLALWTLPPGPSATDFAVRELTPAESLAVRAEVMLHGSRWSGAQALLDEALTLDPHLPQAHETMGFLLLKQERRAEAAPWFARAAANGSNSYLAHYWHALLSLPAARDRAALDAVRASLERVIQLNPGFAPGYAALAGAWIHDREKALPFARRAVELEPDVSDHRLGMGTILLALGRLDEALDLAERMLAASRTPQERASAQALLDNLQQRMPRPTGTLQP
jgi:tetratricopeptide (TPR) repeat protein